MNPLDWTGPEFLKLYIGLLIAAVFVALALRWLLRLPAGDAIPDQLENSPYESAYLAGGADAATDAAIVRLIHHRDLSLDTSRLRLTRKGDRETERLHPLEKSVYQAVDAETGSLLTRVRQSTAATADKMRSRLEGLGLIIPASRAKVVRWAPICVIVAVGLFGVAKLFVGLERHRPVGFLIVLLGISVITAFVLWRLPCFRSRLGDATLDKLKRNNAALEYTAGRRSHALTDDDLVMAIGLFGVGVLAGGPLGYLPTPMRTLPPPRITSSSSSCSTWFSSCGSSSSCGGGCGGGGCGGCGG